MGMGTVAKRSSSKTRHQQRSSQSQQPPSQQRPQSAFGQNQNQAQSHSSVSGSPSTNTARETFLNYFFGQNGPGPIAGSSVDRVPGHGYGHGHGQSRVHGGMGHQLEPAAHFQPIGRDVSGADTSMTGLMAGKRGIDGNNAAYDMKSLGKHIEAVRVRSLTLPSTLSLLSLLSHPIQQSVILRHPDR
jgi:dynamin 1-like protein